MRAFATAVAGAGASAYHALREAMDHYEKAMNFAIPGNDDAILRWNTCARDDHAESGHPTGPRE